MKDWQIKISKKVKMKSPVLVSGLPGIGNVGKVAVDFMVDNLKATKIADFFSPSFPNSVFVGEDNLVELPKLELFYAKKASTEVLFLVGDFQPSDERASYSFCDEVLTLFKSNGGKEIITLGGIGLKELPEKPKFYITGSDSKFIKKLSKITKADPKLYGIVGPIMGVTGLLLGLAPKYKLSATSLLIETYNHPMYLGMKEARDLVQALNKYLKLKINIKLMDKEIAEVEKEVLKKVKDIQSVQKNGNLKKSERDVNYIG